MTRCLPVLAMKDWGSRRGKLKQEVCFLSTHYMVVRVYKPHTYTCTWLCDGPVLAGWKGCPVFLFSPPLSPSPLTAALCICAEQSWSEGALGTRLGLLTAIHTFPEEIPKKLSNWQMMFY